MKVSIFAGNIADADTEAVCTSTNPRLSLVMGTGAAVRSRGGLVILHECEAIVKDGPAALGSAHVTTAGSLPCRIAIHCVASDLAHRSSVEVVRQCVRNAIGCADRFACASVAMPVFASGHAHVSFARAVTTIAETLRDMQTTMQHVILVVRDNERAAEARSIVEHVLGVAVPVSQSPDEEPEEAALSWFGSEQ